MNTEEILAAIDEQIAQLQQARELVSGSAFEEARAPRSGRPKGSTNKAAPAPVKAEKRVMSAEGKARIAAAQKARWKAQKNAENSSTSSTKKSAPAPTKKAAAKG